MGSAEEQVRGLEAEVGALEEAEKTHGVLSWHAGSRRARVRDAGCALLLNHFSTAQAHSVESLVWRFTCHKPIAALRAQLEQEARKGASVRKLAAQLHTFLDTAERYYEHLATRLKAGAPGTRSSTHQSVAKCYACLGDLARYRQHLRNAASRDWAQAAEHYHTALLYQPSNGAPRNQLAVLATQSDDDLSALFFYYSSALSEAPFPYAHENTKVMLGRAKHRFNKVAKQCTTKRNGSSKGTGAAVSFTNGNSKKASFDELLATLMRQSFVEVQRCVFEGKQRKQAEEAFGLLQASLSELGCNMCSPMLAQDPLAHGATAALQMVTGAIFGVELAGELGDEDHCTAEAREIALETLHITTKRVAALARTLLGDSRTNEVELLLPALLVFLEYQESCGYRVNPLPRKNGKSSKRKKADSERSAWPDVAAVLTELAKTEARHTGGALSSFVSKGINEHSRSTTVGQYWPCLPEDRLLAGCKPFSHAHARVDLEHTAGGDESTRGIETSRRQRILARGRDAAQALSGAPLAMDNKTGLFTVASGMPSKLVNGRTAREQQDFEQEVAGGARAKESDTNSVSYMQGSEYANGDRGSHEQDAFSTAAGVSQVVDEEEDEEEIVWSPSLRQVSRSEPEPTDFPALQQVYLGQHQHHHQQQQQQGEPPACSASAQRSPPQQMEQQPMWYMHGMAPPQYQQQIGFGYNTEQPFGPFSGAALPHAQNHIQAAQFMMPQQGGYLDSQQNQQHLLFHQLQQAAAPDGNALFSGANQASQQHQLLHYQPLHQQNNQHQHPLPQQEQANQVRLCLQY